MGATQVTGKQVLDGTIGRPDLNVTTAGQAVIARVLEVANTGIKINASSGANTGTGDVSLKVDTTYLDTLYARKDSITGQRLWGRYTGTAGALQEISIGTGLNLNASTGVLSLSSHAHAIADVTGLQTALDAKMTPPSYPDLVAIEALAGTNGVLKKTATNTWALDTNTYLTSITKTQVEEVLTGAITSHTHSDYYSASISRTANTFLAAPNGSAGAASFRAIVSADIPILNQSTTGSAATLTTARTLTIGNTGKTFNGSANVAWSLDEIGAAPVSQISATLPATAGWYRVATSAVGIARCSGRFEIDWAVASYHGQVTINAGVMYGQDPTLNLIHYSHYGNSINKARIVYHTTYSGNYAYLEIYNSVSVACVVTVQLFSTLGWSLITPSTAGSVPSGYSSQELSFVDGIATEGILFGSSIVKSGGTSTQFLKADGSVDSTTYAVNNQTMYIGMSALVINRASASMALTGITSIDGSAAKLTTARNINGTAFDGSGNITTAVWGTARNFTIGGYTLSVDGSSNREWTLANIGAASLASPALTGIPTAPTAVAGTNTTQIATTAFVISQVNNAVPAATETTAGIVKLATESEVTFLTNLSSAVTPGQLAAAFQGSKNLNGYIKFPNGVIIQWGQSTATTGTTVYYPISFPNYCRSVVATAGDGLLQISTLTNTSFYWHDATNDVTTAWPVKWIAIGY